jgi:putative zinc finger protein
VTLELGAETLPRSPHDEFLELCALSTSGELTPEEQQRLIHHLAICASCREARLQFESVVGNAISAMVLDQTGTIESDSSWTQGQAEAEFFQRLTLEEELGPKRKNSGGGGLAHAF